MAEEKITEQTSVTGNEVEDSTQDYLAAIKELKQNSVDRSEYEKLKAENKKLIDAVVNGQQLEVEPEDKHRDVQEIRDELFNHEHNNLDYIKLALELRESLISEGKPDPFLPMGAQISATAEDVEMADKVAAIYQECIDYSKGDSALFTQELMRRTNTSMYDRIPAKKK